MFTVLLGKRLFHQIRSQDSTLISVLLNTVLTVSHWYSFFFIARDIQSDYHRHFTRWLISVSCALNVVALKCWENCRTYIHSLLNWTPAFAHLRTHSIKFAVFYFYFFNICIPFPFQNKENWKCLLNFGTLFRLWWEQCNPTSTTYTRAVIQVKSGDEIW